MSKVVITALGHTLGPRQVTSTQLEQQQGLEAGFVEKRAGIRVRPWLNEGQAPSELGAAAIQTLGLSAPPDWLLCATSTPERFLPPTGASVMARLGWSGPMTVDLSGGCMGFLAALALGEGLLLASHADTVVVLAQEAMSRLLNPKDHRTNVLFGDGAGAVVLKRKGEGKGVMTLGPALQFTEPENSHVLQVPGGGSLAPTTSETLHSDERFLSMDGKAVFNFAVDVLPRMARQVCEKAGWLVSEVDWLFPHQSNLRILEPAAAALGLPMEKVAHHLGDHGNLAAASIPVLLSEWYAAGRLKPGQKLVMAAYGSGLAFGARAAMAE